MMEEDRQEEMDQESLAASKARLRKDLIRQREALDPARTREWSAELCRQLLTSELPERIRRLAAGPEPCIALYVAMRGEADCQMAWDPLRAAGFALCFPRMIQRDGRPDLEFLKIQTTIRPETCFTTSRFGVREPDAALIGSVWIPCEPDLILLPGLAFDRSGHRLGWGQGYYDHYLKRRLARPETGRPCLVGVAFPPQILDAVPAAAWDIPVDFLLTPAGLIKTR
jgi:5-formyltetrahydrofolate cyclo-ligase